MLQTDAVCKHTMQQNATTTEALPQTPLGELRNDHFTLNDASNEISLW